MQRDRASDSARGNALARVTARRTDMMRSTDDRPDINANGVRGHCREDQGFLRETAWPTVQQTKRLNIELKDFVPLVSAWARRQRMLVKLMLDNSTSVDVAVISGLHRHWSLAVSMQARQVVRVGWLRMCTCLAKK